MQAADSSAIISSPSPSPSALAYDFPTAALDAAATTPSTPASPSPFLPSYSFRAPPPASAAHGGKRQRSEPHEATEEGRSRQRGAEQSASPVKQRAVGRSPPPPPQRTTVFQDVRRHHVTRHRAQLEKQQQEEEKRRQVAEQEEQQKQQRREERRQRRHASLSSRLSSSDAARLSRHACRELSRPETARVLIIGGGPAGLSAAYHLLLDGYSDVQILEARDRLGGRVNTLQLKQLVDRALQQRRREVERGQVADDGSVQRLEALSRCPGLGVVDEGAAFIHGYKQPNPMRAIFPREEVRRKSEGNEQWWDGGSTLLPELVDTARDIYELISDRVLDVVEMEEAQREMDSSSKGDSSAATDAALSDDRSVAEYFTKELDSFWLRRQQLRERREDSDTELRLWRTKRSVSREQEADSDSDSGSDSSSLFCSPPSSFSQDISNSQASSVTASSSTSSSSSSSSPSAHSRQEQLKRILAALSTSQHAYVALSSQLSARDLLHCANEPPLVTPEMVPSRGYGWLTHWLLARLTERRAPTPRLGCQVTRIEERPQREQQAEESKEGDSESCFVQVTALQAEDGRKERLIADYVIVTAPIGVLRDGSIAFSPPLSAVHACSAPSVSRDECVRQLRMGRESKIVLCWSEPWWRQYEHLQYFRSPQHPCIKIINLAALKTSKHTLVIHFAPPLAAVIETQPTAVAAAYALEILRSMFGPDVPESDFCYVTRWGVDEWSLGSYSYVPVGSSSSYSSWLADVSSQSRVLFAGEHCAGGDMQTVHGAYRSGEQAARRIKLLVAQHGLREAEHRQVRQAAEQELRDGRNRQAEQERVQAAALASVPAAFFHRSEEVKADGQRDEAELQQLQKQEKEDALPLSALTLLLPSTSSLPASPAASRIRPSQRNARPGEPAAAVSAAPPSSLAALFSSSAPRQPLPAYLDHLDHLASSLLQRSDGVSSAVAEQPSSLSPLPASSAAAAAATSSHRNPCIEAMDADDEQDAAAEDKRPHADTAGQHRRRIWAASNRTQAKTIELHPRSRLPLVAAVVTS